MMRPQIHDRPNAQLFQSAHPFGGRLGAAVKCFGNPVQIRHSGQFDRLRPFCRRGRENRRRQRK
jgi:hypothetical protein